MSVHQMATDRPPKWAATNKMFTALRGHTSSINALAYRWDKGASPRHILFSGSGDETIRVWDVEQGNCIQELEKSHSGYVSSLLVVDDYLISGSFDRTMCLWNVHRRSLIKSIKAHTPVIHTPPSHTPVSRPLPRLSAARCRRQAHDQDKSTDGAHLHDFACDDVGEADGAVSMA